MRRTKKSTMKKLIYTLMFMLMLIPAVAQNSAEAKTLLDNVSNAYQAKNSFFLKFNSVLNNSQTNTKDSYAGEVYVKKEKYNLAIDKLDIRQIYDGTKLYTISKDQQEVTITKPDPKSDELFTPTKVFDMYKTGFNLAMGETKKVNGKNVTFVKLTPTNDKNIKHVLVGIDKLTNDMVQLVEVNNNNTTTTITVEKQVNDIIVPKSILNFNKSHYSDYYISEL